jgi:membrane-bound lytic murein transglycosylase D
VREGETLWDISQMYGVRLSNLLDFNRFDSVQRLQRGRVIWLQATRPKNKPIEYIEMPEELAEVENMMVAMRTKNVEKTYVKQDTIKTLEVKSLPNDINLSALQSSQEIDKEQPKLVNRNDVSIIKKDLPNEVNLTTLSLNQEIGKENQQPLELKDKEVVSMKTELPKEIELNSLPLVQAIKEEQPDNASMPKSVDNQQVSKIDVKDEAQVITINGQNSTKNKLISEEAGEGEENNNFLEHIVKKGETLFRISVNFNVALAELWAWNNLKSTIVKEGTVLKIKR